MITRHPSSRDSDTADALCEAAFALGTLAEAVRRSPLRGAWRLRETAHVAATLTTRRFGHARAEELFAIVAGAPNQRAFASGELLTALAFWRHGLERWFAAPLPSPWIAGGDGLDEDDEALLPSAPEDAELARTDAADPVARTVAAMTRPPSSFAAILDRAVAHAGGDAGIGALELAVPLAFQPITGTVLPALALATVRRNTGKADVVRCARRMIVEAEAAHGRLRALERAWHGWRNRLPESRADSRLFDVVDLLARTPLLAAPSVAATLGLTRKAAVHHLNTLQDAGVLREVTGRARWRLFCASNLPLTTWSRKGTSLGPKGTAKADEAAPPEPPNAVGMTPPPPVDLAAIDRMLADAYAQIDRASSKVSASLIEGGST